MSRTFQTYKIPPLQFQYIQSLLLLVVANGMCYRVYSEIHNIYTRKKPNLYLPISNLSAYQKGSYYSGIKVFNNLRYQLKNLFHNRNQFKRALKHLLYFHSFCTLHEYFNNNGF
jgi:hypothetical protein